MNNNLMSHNFETAHQDNITKANCSKVTSSGYGIVIVVLLVAFVILALAIYFVGLPMVQSYLDHSGATKVLNQLK